MLYTKYINNLLYKAEMTSVRLTVTSIAQWFLHGSTWDLVCVQLWFWNVNARFNKFLTALCWAHERFKYSGVVLFAIIFGRVKF